MIKIRYNDALRPGLNASAERGRRGTTVYLLPGLTSAQRRAALRRLRQQGRMALGPSLPMRDLAVALAALRLRTAAARAGAIVRVHPAGTTVPLLLLSAAVAVFVLTSVSVRIVAPPQAAGHRPGDGLLPSPSPVGDGPGFQHAQPIAVGSAPARPPSGVAHRHEAAVPEPRAPVATATSGTGGSPLSSIAATSPPPPVTSSAPPAAPSSSAPPPTPPAVPSSNPVPRVRGQGNCVTIGFLQVCLTL